MNIPAQLRKLAREWAGQLADYMDARDLCGYDPFDIKEHALIRAAQPYPLLRRTSSVACDLFPNLSRRFLRVQPARNAKAYALAALGHLRLYQLEGAEQHLERARELLRWLLDNPCAGWSGLCWGYPFSVSAKGLDTPAGTPIGVVTAIAGEAFCLAYQITGAEIYRSSMAEIAAFVLNDLPRIEEEDGSVCFAYTPNDRRRVHNANLHAAAHLYRTAYCTQDTSFAGTACAALRFTLERQRGDGSWPYGEWREGEPYEKALLDIVDHHHTGFVLRSLHAICELAPSNSLRDAIHRGWLFYRGDLFTPAGMPVTKHARYPVDIHACAEAILCPAVLHSVEPGALQLAGRAMEWSARNMRDARTGAVYYRKYPGFTSRLVCMRWGVAWMFYALCEFLYQSRPGAEESF